jgi:hypothetical protein
LVLDTETISNFSGGVYLQWNVTGNAIITVTKEAGANAVISGLFLDPGLVSESIDATGQSARGSSNPTGVSS